MFPYGPRLRLLLFLLLCTGGRAHIFAQTEAYREALDRVFEQANYLTALSPVGFRPGLCMAASEIAVGTSQELAIHLEAGRNYTFIATTETSRALLDLHLNGLSDEADDGTPILEFAPARSGTYQLRIYLRAADEPSLTTALAILENGGPSLNRDVQSFVRDAFFTETQQLLRSQPRWRLGEDWPILVLFTPSAYSVNLEKIPLNQGKYALGLASGPALQQSTLSLADANHRIQAQTNSSGAFPQLRYRTEQSGPYTIHFDNREATSNLIYLGRFAEE